MIILIKLSIISILFLAGLVLVVYASAIAKWIVNKFVNESVDKMTKYLRMNGSFLMLIAAYIFYKMIPLFK